MPVRMAAWPCGILDLVAEEVDSSLQVREAGQAHACIAALFRQSLALLTVEA